MLRHLLQVAFNFVPSREHFMHQVAGSCDPDSLAAMQSFIDQFSPVLAEVHTFLVGSILPGEEQRYVFCGRGGGATGATRLVAGSRLCHSRPLCGPRRV